MDILSQDLNSITANDLAQLCADRVAEGLTLEFKADLPSRAGKAADSWYAGKSFSEGARNAIAEEVVAFANTFGGVVLLGINETSDKPSRAESINSLPRVHELARSLRQPIHDVVYPPLAGLESEGIECDGAGGGVVLIRVPPSRRKPHRLNANREVYIRRMDETVKVGMRQIQELTIQGT